MATLNPEFFRVFEFQVTMPGESQLKLKVRCQNDKDGPDVVARGWWWCWPLVLICDCCCGLENPDPVAHLSLPPSLPYHDHGPFFDADRASSRSFNYPPGTRRPHPFILPPPRIRALFDSNIDARW